MRLTAALFLIAAPVCAAAQPATKPPPSHDARRHKSTVPTVRKPSAPPAHKPSAATRAAPKPDHKAAPAKAPAKPAPKPAPNAHPVAPPRPAPEPAPPDTSKGSSTGLPLPRFAALRSDDVNFRTGPGTRYKIDWVYKRRDLPVEIEREFEVWRLVRDQQGTKGWVHQATLTGRRTAIVAGGEHALRQAASDNAGPVAELQRGVILRIRGCEADSDWCQAQVGDYRGWIKRTEIWGVLPEEVIQ